MTIKLFMVVVTGNRHADLFTSTIHGLRYDDVDWRRVMSGITLAPIPLGTVVAERHFILWDSEGKKREIVVKLGSPVPIDPEYGLTPYMFRCPAQIIGLGVDKHVYSPAGEDAFAALCNALDLIGQILESQSKSLNLQNRHKRHDARTPPWVWQYLDGLGES